MNAIKILGLGCLSFLCPALVDAVNIVNYDSANDYVAVDTNLNRLLSIKDGNFDFDGGLGSLDAFSIQSMDLATPLSPASGYSGPAFYGAIQAIRYNSEYGTSAWSSQTNRIHSLDGLENRMGGSAGSENQHIFSVVFKQSDWLGLNSGQTGFQDGGSTNAFFLKTKGFNNEGDTTLRWVIQNSGNFYVSNTSYAMPASTVVTIAMTNAQAYTDTWAQWDATNAVDIRVPASGYTIAGSTFQNITAVGYVTDTGRLTDTTAPGKDSGTHVDEFSSDLAELNSPVQVLMDFGAGELDLSTNAAFNYGGTSRVENDNDIALDLTSYAQVLWHSDGALPDIADPSGIAAGVSGVDLSEFNSGAKDLVINGSFTIPAGEKARIYLYSNTLDAGRFGMVVQDITTSFSGSYALLSGSANWNPYASDGLTPSNSTTNGTVTANFDWSNVTTFSIRTQSAGTVSYSLDSISLGGPVAGFEASGLTLVIASGSDPTVSFLTKSGATYQLQKSTTDLNNGSFSNVAGQSVSGDGTEKTLSDPAGNPTSGQKAFYRVLVN